MRLRALILRPLLAILVAIPVAYLVLAPTGRYLLRAAWAEGSILAHRRSIAGLVADSATPPAVRAKLRVVLAARAYAQDSLGLAAKQSFTTYSKLPHDTLVLVLSGAARDRLAPVTWWFPIVGRVPYKGYFDFAAARDAERALEARGFDAYVRPSPAFSTLGVFNDPLLSTTLADDSLGLANTVIHELTHNTFYLASRIPFDESFANFDGARGSEAFYRSRGDTALARVAADRWADEKLLGAFWDRLYRSVDSAYRAHPGPADSALRVAAHDTVYGRARDELVADLGPKLRTIDPRYLSRVRLDNAVLLAQRIYYTDLGAFDAVYDREGRDLRRTIRRVIAIAKSRPDDPFAALDAWVARVDSTGRAALPAAAAGSTAAGSGAAKPPAKQRP
ncbi:MAG: aminopeptidase [Gemmatimonadota bacterium]|nr:aminopeptidase [Gemmatimonadota bacterium]